MTSENKRVNILIIENILCLELWTKHLKVYGEKNPWAMNHFVNHGHGCLI